MFELRVNRIYHMLCLLISVFDPLEGQTWQEEKSVLLSQGKIPKHTTHLISNRDDYLKVVSFQVVLIE
jgi:hypothetical protein